jgi:hypothetical protein
MSLMVKTREEKMRAGCRLYLGRDPLPMLLLGGVVPCILPYISRNHVELLRPAFTRLFGIDSRFRSLV